MRVPSDHLKSNYKQMKNLRNVIYIAVAVVLLSAFSTSKDSYSLTINVTNLRNSEGMLQFTLYNNNGSIPDDDFKKYYKLLKKEIVNGKSSVTFKNLPRGQYAVNILHDENNDGKIKKGLLLPIEGIGFSNFTSIGLLNRPTFSKASFNLEGNKMIKVSIIYL